MTLKEFIENLQKLEQQGYGDYRVVFEYNFDISPCDEKDVADDERGKIIQII